MRLRITGILGAMLIALLLVGCGGGGGGGSSTTGGTLTPILAWAARVVGGTNAESVVIDLLQNNVVVTTRTVNRQAADPAYSETVTFTSLSAGTYTVRITLFPAAGGSGGALRSASIARNVVSGQTTSVNFSTSTNPTVASVVIDGPPANVNAGQSAQLMAVARDGANNIVAVPSANLTWSLTTSGHAGSVSNTGLFQGLRQGTETVKVTESTSNLSGQASIGVFSGMTSNLSSTAVTGMFMILSGQGRAPGSPSAQITQLQMIGGSTTVGSAAGFSFTIQLDGYKYGSGPFSSVVASGTDSIALNSFSVDIPKLFIEGGDPAGIQTKDLGGAAIFPKNFPLNGRFMPGRDTAVQIFLDDAMLNQNTGGTSCFFDNALFQQINFDSGQSYIGTFFSDAIAFNISAVASRPSLANGNPAKYVFFTGDDSAMGDASLNYQVNGAIGLYQGTYVAATPTVDGSYIMSQADPRDPLGGVKITALNGRLRAVESVLSNPGNFEIITLPSSSDNATQTMLAAVMDNAGTITNAYFGTVNLQTGLFTMYPVAQLTNGSTANALTGTVAGLKDRNGAPTSVFPSVRSGAYAFGAGQTLPIGFASAGRFTVLRG